MAHTHSAYLEATVDIDQQSAGNCFVHSEMESVNNAKSRQNEITDIVYSGLHVNVTEF